MTLGRVLIINRLWLERLKNKYDGQYSTEQCSFNADLNANMVDLSIPAIPDAPVAKDASHVEIPE